ncbi:MAG: amidohydrolase [Planctomyces sp.]|nr:amidohydrolase [Planctomyces sp.]
MTDLQRRLFDELETLVLIDPHTHINPHAPASRTLADILGYHYYTELAHSSGAAKVHLDEAGIGPKERVGRIVESLEHLGNTIQVSWLLEMAREFFGFEHEAITSQNWEGLYDAAVRRMAHPDWESTVLEKSRLEKVFLTNEFDDPLEGFDTERYVPCLRTDDLVFKLHEPQVRERLAKATGIDGGGRRAVREAIGRLFDRFVKRGARACAISLPPWFSPHHVGDQEADEALAEAYSGGASASGGLQLSRWVFWTLAEFCVEHRLPFDLMIGVNRRVYENGVYQGQDLFDMRVSLIQYKDLFNAFPQVTFPVSVLGHTSNQELVSYAWIFPNVATSGHWWYSNIPTYIELDTRARLEAVPRNKQIGYYSDMYKLEFALPKFRMYRRVLAKVLAEDFVIGRGWTETQALALGRQVLRGNVERIFRV